MNLSKICLYICQETACTNKIYKLTRSHNAKYKGTNKLEAWIGYPVYKLAVQDSYP